MRLFVAETDPALGAFLKSSLEGEGYGVELSAANTSLLWPAAGNGNGDGADTPGWDAAILDLNAVSDEGLSLLRRARETSAALPILVLTSRGRSEDRVRVLDSGADDLVLKPFAFSELSARLRALLRRGGVPADMVLRVEDLELSRVEHTVKRAGRRIDLTPKEFALLEYLMRNAGQRVTRAEIIERVWNLSFNTMTNVVDVYINYSGNSSTTAVEITNGESVNINVPGDQLFLNASGSVFGAINSLIGAVQSGSGISNAVTALGTAASQFNSERLNYGTSLTQLQSASTLLGTESVQLSTQQSTIDGANIPAVTTQFNQAQTAYESLLAAEGRILQLPTLLDFIE